MARFALVIRPDGRALLVTAEPFATETLEPVRAALDEWIQGKYTVGVLAETAVIRVEELEVDLDKRLINRVAS